MTPFSVISFLIQAAPFSNLVRQRDFHFLEDGIQGYIPLASVYGIFTYIYQILPLKTTKCR